MADQPTYFHVGVIVAELEPALEEFGALLGVGWRPIVDSEVPVREADGSTRTLRLRFAYSQTQPFLEIIEAVPDSPWALAEGGSNLHHLGRWVGDLPGESARFATAACPLEVCMVGEDQQTPATFAYHRAHGVRFELVDEMIRSMMFPDGS